MKSDDPATSPAEPRAPAGARRVLHALTGGGSYTAQFLRGLLWSHRVRAIVVIVLANVTGLLVVAEVVTFKLVVDAFQLGAAAPGGPDPLAKSIRSLGWLRGPMESLRESLSASGFVLAIIGILVALRVIQPIVMLLSKWTSIRISTGAYRDLRRRMFRQFVGMRYGAMLRYRTGDLVQYLNELTATTAQVTLYSDLIGGTITCAFIIVTLVLASWQLAIGLAVLLLAVVWPLSRLMLSIRGEAVAHVRASKQLNEQTLEFLGGLRQVHTYSREDYATGIVDEEIDAAVRAKQRGLSLKAATSPVQAVVGALSVGAVLVGGYMWLDEDLGTVVMYVYGLQRVLRLITGVGNTIAMIQHMWPPSERVASILRRDDKEYVQSGRTPFASLTDALEFRDVTMRYDDGTIALDRVSFEVPHGRMIAFVGPSGAGKSSVVNLLLRLYDPTSGEIVADGTPIAELRIEDWRGAIGLVDQDAFVFNASVAENIRFGKLDATQAEIEAATRAAHVDGVIDKLPERYDTLVGERGTRLSGGERQRLAIARALVRRPSILVLDEATSALDSESERIVQTAIDKLRQGQTIVAIAHRLSTIAMADEIVVLDRGKVAERGTHEELLTQDGIYAGLWRRQITGGAGA